MTNEQLRVLLSFAADGKKAGSLDCLGRRILGRS